MVLLSFQRETQPAVCLFQCSLAGLGFLGSTRREKGTQECSPLPSFIGTSQSLALLSLCPSKP